MPVDPRLLAAMDAPHGAGRDLVSGMKPKRGYAAPPGTGPAGETCASCRQISVVQDKQFGSTCQAAPKGPYGGRVYMSPTSRACRRWEARG